MKKIFTWFIIAIMAIVPIVAFWYIVSIQDEQKINSIVEELNEKSSHTRETVLFYLNSIIDWIKKDDIYYWPFFVTKVTDWDTIHVDYYWKDKTLRIIWLDTPETYWKKECYGSQATARAKTLLKDKQVYLKVDPKLENTDMYNRLLRYVYIDDLDFTQIMLEEWFWEYAKYWDFSREESYEKFEQNAKNQNIWLWKYCKTY